MTKKLIRSRTLLNISLFIAALSSVFWFIFSLRYINMTAILSSNNIELLYQATIIILLPITIIWILFAFINNKHQTQYQLRGILEYLQRNNEFSAGMCTAMLGVEHELKSGFMLKQFNILISDINEILADIIKRSNSISSTQMEYLWTRTAGGERWLIAKTFIETYTFQSGFASHLLQKAKKNNLLKGSILEFQTRYVALRDLLENYDKQRLFYNIVVYGALGKVYNLLEPIANELLKTQTENHLSQKPTLDNTQSDELLSFPSFFNNESSTSEEFQPSYKKNIDSGLKAIRDEILTAPTISKQNSSPAPTISASNNLKIQQHPQKLKRTVISLDELEKEINSSPENNYDEYAYPFGAWTNDKNNK